MTLKIERLVRGADAVVLRLCGRIEVKHLSTITELIEQESEPVIFDLEEVQLVDREAVLLLERCERKGITLSNCPGFLREWLNEEKRCIDMRP